MKTKKITILHTNDMHGDFLAETVNGNIKKSATSKIIGGLARLSGYINQVRNEEENVIYAISGDMLQGSLIDTEYKGISTMEIMNFLCPDVVTLGNHEFDYGLPHLLFLEKMANFPIVNANLYIKPYQRRLMKPFHIINKGGLDILFTGIITQKVIDSIKTDKLIGSFVTLEEASKEVGKICNAYKNDDIDLTVLLTHIGLESDISLAKLLKAEWGVDLIIGGHSHTELEKPVIVKNILIVQAKSGTDQIGRMDIIVDEKTNSILKYDWKLIPINENIAKPDKKIEDFINNFQNKVDQKYSTVISKLSNEATHPVRESETSLGNLIADAFAQNAQTDIMLVGSGSIRVKKLGPVITQKDLLAAFPYDDSLVRFIVSGKDIKKIFNHILRPDNLTGEGECYQVNNKVAIIYDKAKNNMVSLKINGKDIDDNVFYNLCLQSYHFNNASAYLGIDTKILLKKGGSKVVTTSAREVLEEYLRNHQNIKTKVENRIVFI